MQPDRMQGLLHAARMAVGSSTAAVAYLYHLAPPQRLRAEGYAYNTSHHPSTSLRLAEAPDGTLLR
jgi:hypothetical protein